MLALDIGGANLKAADGRGWTAARPFPLWRRPRELPQALADLLAAAPPADAIAVTMTGELADCFATKAEGVETIVSAAVQSAAGRRVLVYRVDGAFASPEMAIAEPLMAAASNWHALARFAGRFAPEGASLLIDIGSTTCDLVPLRTGRPVAMGRTDTERLLHGELVYTGVERSPICAVVGSAPWRGRRCPVAQELFATTWDAYLVLGDLPEEPDNIHTADGRPATRPAAHDRLARMICAERSSFSAADASAFAREVALAQLDQIIAAALRVTDRAGWPRAIAVSGQGEFLARRVAERLAPRASMVALSELLGKDVSRCAPAHALAVLAREQRVSV
jgi:(4-(4-[2-(gamma-L-glutamylamino)ethyl]phenoxymethyl)furan-2-yl)methanamine synthase